MSTYVLYHAGCFDGFCAAWIAKKHLPEATEFIPVNYGQPEPDMKCGSVVYILDFSYPRQAMRNLLSQMRKIVVLDHHKTAEAELAGLADEFTQPSSTINRIQDFEWPIIRFDMSKSGARLTWEHFNAGEYPPWLVRYTEDRDLWQWQLAFSREVNAALRTHPFDFKVWDELNALAPLAWNGLRCLVNEGEAILRREQQIIDSHVGFACEIRMDGHNVLAVNATVLSSEIAGELAKDRPFGACYFIRADGKRIWSLRSDSSGIDVSEVAKRRGGGGHFHAAGFEE